MNGLIIFMGASFRLGTQGTTNIGDPMSYDEQIKACNSHIEFIEKIINNCSLNSVSVFISTYNTQFNNNLLSIYNKYLLGYNFYNHFVGLNNLFHKSMNYIEDINKYSFILYIRIDLFLKEYFINSFNPTRNVILYPTICWINDCKVGKDPRVNDMLLFIPKKYFNYIKNIIIGHDLWHILIRDTQLTYDDMDTIINTYHDSDSYKDFNPLYYIVNRNKTNIFHSEGHIFDKYNFK
jgi:hypothetical protein